MNQRQKMGSGDTVAVSSRVSIDKVGNAFAATLRGVDAALDAWVSSTADGYDLWLRVKPIDLAAEREIYALVDPLYARFPSARFMLHVLNPETILDLAPEAIVPAQARHVAVRASA